MYIRGEITTYLGLSVPAADFNSILVSDGIPHAVAGNYNAPIVLPYFTDMFSHKISLGHRHKYKSKLSFGHMGLIFLLGVMHKSFSGTARTDPGIARTDPTSSDPP